MAKCVWECENCMYLGTYDKTSLAIKWYVITPVDNGFISSQNGTPFSGFSKHRIVPF